MNEFRIWFSTGLEHIININAFDHILFIVLLSITVKPTEWKKLLILITGFTLGHSLSLFLSVTTHLHYNTALVEFLIALTILITGIYNLYHSKNIKNSASVYFVVTFFGLIHGLGFSGAIKGLLGASGCFFPLFYFNLGLELGQLIIVISIYFFSLLLTSVAKWQLLTFKRLLICCIVLFSIVICTERFLEFVQSY